MNYFITGATGFIGSQLLQRLAKRPGDIYLLNYDKISEDRLEALLEKHNLPKNKFHCIKGSITEPNLGISAEDTKKLTGKIDQFFHLAAIYDLTASEEDMMRANIDGTEHTLRFAERINAGCFHYFSSIAVAGQYRGWFREDMLNEATGLEHAYFSTKHNAEKLVQETATIPWRAYRPGIVIGDSKTGEADRIDGPYYFFKIIQKLRRALPEWAPLLGLEGGRLNLVPVDYVADAIDHISHKPELDNQCFHIVDPDPYRSGEVINLFAEAGHAPRMAMRLDMRVFRMIPSHFWSQLGQVPVLKRFIDAISKEMDMPQDALTYFNYPTQFDCSNTLNALSDSNICCPRLADYADKIWDYWERNLDPELHVEKTLEGCVNDKVVVITGASSGIGYTTAIKLAKTKARLVLIARDLERLQQVRNEIERLGGQAFIYQCDLSQDAPAQEVIQQIKHDHGKVDILINNAGRSIRRSVEKATDRLHDYERTMQINYFGALRMILGNLPEMIEAGEGHIINISSIAVLTNQPLFSAYAASKSALDTFTRTASTELGGQGIDFTTINMPLVETRMISDHYRETEGGIPLLTPEEAADLIIKAIIEKPKRIATKLGLLGAFIHGVYPKLGELLMATGYNPDHGKHDGEEAEPKQPSADVVALNSIMREIHM
ncbi:short-chain dehydrogenase [Photobacterium gaetbulicola]|uniref:Short-chain dehydrogenase n=1 Tax=Photobacterium gaetbulicola TaxID=1295392 RepID=A0A0B9G596_9GAMM|nr:SDR family oxidoreductase [Photobacterium gaetbulicola]KHT63774.1 short-chain dehydrogenase [Photobacterium gaetbulicola]